jgi:glycerol-3-phosphate cytidylyltransferase-like family protein
MIGVCSQFVITGVFDSLHKGDSEELTTAENVVLYLPNEHGILKASNQLIFNDMKASSVTAGSDVSLF